jgi:hypothetical protein
MLFEIILFIIAIWLAIVILKSRENFDIIENKTTMFRPNCPQLNSRKICSSTPGCYRHITGCINMLEDIQEPRKEWEKHDFLLVE